MNLQTLARALGGEVSGRQVLAPGPGHSPQDCSLSIRIDPSAPGGFLVHSFAGDDPLTAKDYVREQLGLKRSPDRQPVERRPPPVPVPIDDAERTVRALAIWFKAKPDHPLLQKYLAARSVELPPRALGEVVRFHPRCPWGGGKYVPAMV